MIITTVTYIIFCYFILILKKSLSVLRILKIYFIHSFMYFIFDSY